MQHELVGVLARPFRLSCVAFAMTNDAQTCASFDCKDEDTIASVYNGSAVKSSVSEWIHQHRNEESTRDLYYSDESEGCFLTAIKAGAQISRTQVCLCKRPTWSSTAAKIKTDYNRKKPRRLERKRRMWQSHVYASRSLLGYFYDATCRM